MVADPSDHRLAGLAEKVILQHWQSQWHTENRVCLVWRSGSASAVFGQSLFRLGLFDGQAEGEAEAVAEVAIGWIERAARR